MIAHDGQAHDDEHDGQLCPRCQATERVGDYVLAAAIDGAEQWQEDVGPFIDKMHSALWALQRVWAEEQTHYADDIDNVGESARALVELFVRLHTLIHSEPDANE